jgi:hypothetical protein
VSRPCRRLDQARQLDDVLVARLPVEVPHTKSSARSCTQASGRDATPPRSPDRAAWSFVYRQPDCATVEALARAPRRKPRSATSRVKKPEPPTPEVQADAAIIADAIALGRRDEVVVQIGTLLPLAVAEYQRQFPSAIYYEPSIRCLFCAVTRDTETIQLHVEECGLRFLAGLRKPVSPLNHCPWCGQGRLGHPCRVMPDEG